MKRSRCPKLPNSDPAMERQWLKVLNTLPIPLGVIRLDGKARIIFFNKAFIKITGYTAQNNPTVQSWIKHVFPSIAYRKATFGNWSKRVLGGPMTRPFQHQIKVRTAFGNDIYVTSHTMRLGQTAFFCFADNTDSETKLKRLRTVMDALPYPIALEEYDPNKNNRNPCFIFINKTFQEQFGCNINKCPRLSDLLGLVYPDAANRTKVYQAWIASYKRQKQGKRVLPTVAQARSASGATVDILINTIPLKDIGIRLVALTDITPQKRLIDALERENQATENQRNILRQRLRSSLTAASVAHEIDTSLGAILLQAKSAIRSLQSEPHRNAAAIAPLQNILNQAEGINLTIDRIRALISNMDTRHEKVDLRGVVESALLSLKDRLQSNGITIQSRYSRGQNTMVGDETQIYLIILNLLRNAVDALSRHKNQKRCIRIKLSKIHRGMSIVIEDSGNGVSADTLRRFTRWNMRESGMGLGLFLVRSAVENHRGKIHFGKSSLKGWKVSVWLPMTHTHTHTHNSKAGLITSS